MRVEFADTTNNGIPVLRATPTYTIPTPTTTEVKAANNSGLKNSLANTTNGTSVPNNVNNTPNNRSRTVQPSTAALLYLKIINKVIKVSKKQLTYTAVGSAMYGQIKLNK